MRNGKKVALGMGVGVLSLTVMQSPVHAVEVRDSEFLDRSDGCTIALTHTVDDQTGRLDVRGQVYSRIPDDDPNRCQSENIMFVTYRDKDGEQVQKTVSSGSADAQFFSTTNVGSTAVEVQYLVPDLPGGCSDEPCGLTTSTK